jgi:hypothetical protein
MLLSRGGHLTYGIIGQKWCRRGNFPFCVQFTPVLSRQAWHFNISQGYIGSTRMPNTEELEKHDWPVECLFLRWPATSHHYKKTALHPLHEVSTSEYCLQCIHLPHAVHRFTQHPCNVVDQATSMASPRFWLCQHSLSWS